MPRPITPLIGELFWIGRIHGGVPDLHVPSTWISRRHTRLVRERGWTVADAGSTNGTRLEDVALSEAAMPLRHGAELQVGRSLFRFVQG